MGKVTRPVLTKVFHRRRLFDLLDGMREQPVVWVSGPPGCGKTTLISSYLDSRDLPCLWYQVDVGDKDPATFFYYLGLAAKKASPRKRKPLPILTSEYLQEIEAFTYRYFENLYDRLRIPGIMVVDNYQGVPLNSLLHEIMLSGVSRIPEGMNVIFISRSDPPPAFIRLRANHLMKVLEWNDLRLTLEEVNGIARLRAKQKLPKETIHHLHTITDGWAAGLVLMLESLKREGTEPTARGKFTPQEILDYFVSELFDKTDRETQKFLLKTAFLPKMTVRMAQELTGLPSASRILSAFVRNNYFIEKTFLDDEPVYQYHPLFREFMLGRAKETFSEVARSALLRRAAILLENAGQIEAAVLLLREVGDWDTIAHFIIKHAPFVLEQGRNRLFEEWLAILPKDIVESHPWLLYWMGICRIVSNPSLGQHCFEKAFEQFKIQEDASGIFLAWSGIVNSIAIGMEDYKPLDRWISVLEELMHHFKVFPSEEIGARVASSMFYALKFRQPEHPEIETWAEQALSLVDYSSNLSAKMVTLSHLALYRMDIGDFQKAWLALDSIRQITQSHDGGYPGLLFSKFAEAVYYKLTGLHEKCLKTVFDSLELSQNSGVHIFDNSLLAAGISSAQNVNDSIMAGKLLERMGSSLSRLKPLDACFYHISKGREASLLGDFGEASLQIDLGLKFSMDVGSPYSLSYAHLIKAHLMHHLGRDREAAEQLTLTLNSARRSKSKISEFTALLAEALFALDQQEEASGLMSLQKALLIGKEQGYFCTEVDQPSRMAKLCMKALEAGIEVEYVQELIRRLNIIPDTPPLHLENWPWALKIFTLGPFGLLIDGKPIRFSRKVQQKPLSMLKALIVFGGREVGEDQIIDALWPEAEGDIAHQSFATTLHRLRQLLGHEKAIRRQEGRLTLEDRYCWVDAWAFERILAQADGKWKDEQIDGALHLIEKAIEMYKGSFLPREIDQPWTTPMRERLQRKFSRYVGMLGNYWQEAGQWEKALDIYHKGLEVDGLIEEFYQGLMNCYYRLDRWAEAISVYHQYRKKLFAVLGIEPSAKTKALYKILTENIKVSESK